MTDVLAQNLPKAKEFRIEGSMPKEAIACIECHRQHHQTKGGFSLIGKRP
jgi:hypothetical protein